MRFRRIGMNVSHSLLLSITTHARIARSASHGLHRCQSLINIFMYAELLGQLQHSIYRMLVIEMKAFGKRMSPRERTIYEPGGGTIERGRAERCIDCEREATSLLVRSMKRKINKLEGDIFYNYAAACI